MTGYLSMRVVSLAVQLVQLRAGWCSFSGAPESYENCTNPPARFKSIVKEETRCQRKSR
jgi:hypothetical protein